MSTPQDQQRLDDLWSLRSERVWTVEEMEELIALFMRGLRPSPAAPTVRPGEDTVPAWAKRKSNWVACPICGEPDMERTLYDDGANQIIECVNHECASNGGSNASALMARHARTPDAHKLALRIACAVCNEPDENNLDNAQLVHAVAEKVYPLLQATPDATASRRLSELAAIIGVKARQVRGQLPEGWVEELLTAGLCGFPSPDATAGALREALDILEAAPELNMSNYDHEDVRRLNDAVIEAWQILRAALAAMKGTQ